MAGDAPQLSVYCSYFHFTMVSVAEKIKLGTIIPNAMIILSHFGYCVLQF